MQMTSFSRLSSTFSAFPSTFPISFSTTTTKGYLLLITSFVLSMIAAANALMSAKLVRFSPVKAIASCSAFPSGIYSGI